MIPQSLSNETFQDSEPNLAVNPANPLQIAGTAFTVDADTTPGPDQPFIQAATQLGGGPSHDHVYIGDNDRPGTGTRTSTIEFSNDAANAAPPSPAGFVKQIVEARGTLFQDAPQVR